MSTKYLRTFFYDTRITKDSVAVMQHGKLNRLPTSTLCSIDKDDNNAESDENKVDDNVDNGGDDKIEKLCSDICM